MAFYFDPAALFWPGSGRPATGLPREQLSGEGMAISQAEVGVRRASAPVLLGPEFGPHSLAPGALHAPSSEDVAKPLSDEEWTDWERMTPESLLSIGFSEDMTRSWSTMHPLPNSASASHSSTARSADFLSASGFCRLGDVEGDLDGKWEPTDDVEATVSSLLQPAPIHSWTHVPEAGYASLKDVPWAPQCTSAPPVDAHQRALLFNPSLAPAVKKPKLSQSKSMPDLAALHSPEPQRFEFIHEAFPPPQAPPADHPTPKSYTLAPPLDTSGVAPRWPRKQFSPSQLRVLEKAFRRNTNPDREERERIAAKINEEVKTVNIWYNNRRAKARAQSRKSAEAGGLE
ncbi:hypothetical protein DFJ74DRAFT_664383 [Hyaloraphidium curvatum]|nr:hypothetical protein DFJ74DRAFT_664383 [Hyaloraphidium curvatum]